MVLQLAATGLGLEAMLTSASQLFVVLRWVGVAYLTFLGLRALLTPAEPLGKPASERSVARVFLRGFAVSLTNPKTLLFYGAFLPQFVDPRGNTGAQILVLAFSFLVLAIAMDSGWALLASRLRGVLSMRPHLRSRLTGATLLGAAAGLALAHEKS